MMFHNMIILTCYCGSVMQDTQVAEQPAGGYAGEEEDGC